MVLNKGRLARLLSRIPVSSRYFGPPRAYAPDLSTLLPGEGRILQELRPKRDVFHPGPRLGNYPEVEAQIRHHFCPLPAPAQHLYQLTQARVLGEGGGHGLITNQDRFILDQHEKWGQEIDNHPVHYTLKFPPCSRCQGTTFSLISNWSDNYWHWLFDVLGKLILLRETASVSLPNIDQYMVLNLSKYPFKRDSLRELGLEETDLVDVAKESHVLCDNLLMADRPHRNPTPEKDLIDALRRSFLREVPAQTKPRRIYISRKNARNRRVANEPELMASLQSLGFEEICLEQMDFASQVRLFQTSEIVVAPHGAGLTNLIFCSPGTRVLELHAEGDINPCYGLICEKLSMSYTMWCAGKPGNLCEGVWDYTPDEIEVNVSDILDLVHREL